MAVRINTTHIWTKLFIPVIWVSRLLSLGMVIWTLESILPNGTLETVILITAFFVTIVLHGVFVEQFYHIVQTFLYVKINLKTNIRFHEAKSFILLFAPTEHGTWYPMTGLRDLPKEYRRKVLFESAHKIYTELGYVFQPDTNEYSGSSESNGLGVEPQHESEASNMFPGFPQLIALLAKISKCDGAVSAEEIRTIGDFFTDVLKLSEEERKEAIRIFSDAKQNTIPFEVYAREFYSFNKHNKDILELVVFLLVSVAFADGTLSSEEEILIYKAISVFDVDEKVYNKHKSKYHSQSSSRHDENEAYYAKVLGLDDVSDPIKIKSVYRKLAVQYHPDKVSHLGDKIREVAEREMKKINEAYDYFQKKYNIV